VQIEKVLLYIWGDILSSCRSDNYEMRHFVTYTYFQILCT